MKLILQEDVEKLGTRGEVVDVADGYARNFLVPRKLGLEATPGNMKRLDKMRATFAKKEATEKGDAQKLAELLAGRFAHLYAQDGRKRSPLRLRHVRRHFRRARSAGLQHREAQDRAGRANQGCRRLRNSREAAPRSNGQRESGRQERRVDALRSRSFSNSTRTHSFLTAFPT